MQWQSEILEYSWKKVGQAGELIRLVATHTPENLPSHTHAKCIATRCWDVHPDTADHYPIYNKPASLLEWVFKERPEGTVLFIDPDCVFRKPVTQQVAPGFPISQDWIDFVIAEPSDVNPFGLGERFAFLKNHCARVDLQADAVMVPTLIHTRDIRRIAARWLELCSAIRENCEDGEGQRMGEADMVGYLVACAEFGLSHKAGNLGVVTNWDPTLIPDSPLIHYCQSLYDVDGDEVFNKRNYQPWTRINNKSQPEHYYGRDFIALLNGFVDSLPIDRSQFTKLSQPAKRANVKEGILLDQTLLEVPEEGLNLWLNETGFAVWQLCDGDTTVEEICNVLGQQYEADADTLFNDVLATVHSLRTSGFLVL